MNTPGSLERKRTGMLVERDISRKKTLPDAEERIKAARAPNWSANLVQKWHKVVSFLFRFKKKPQDFTIVNQFCFYWRGKNNTTTKHTNKQQQIPQAPKHKQAKSPAGSGFDPAPTLCCNSTPRCLKSLSWTKPESATERALSNRG